MLLKGIIKYSFLLKWEELGNKNFYYKRAVTLFSIWFSKSLKNTIFENYHQTRNVGGYSYNLNRSLHFLENYLHDLYKFQLLMPLRKEYAWSFNICRLRIIFSSIKYFKWVVLRNKNKIKNLTLWTGYYQIKLYNSAYLFTINVTELFLMLHVLWIDKKNILSVFVNHQIGENRSISFLFLQLLQTINYVKLHER